MIVLTIRTDKPESEIGLFDDDRQLAYEIWEAHRELAETIHVKIEELLVSCGKTIKDLDGIIVYKGPGSFTGLRIGISVANALASGLQIPIVGSMDEDWIQEGVKSHEQGVVDGCVVPNYGAPVFTTQPRK